MMVDIDRLQKQSGIIGTSKKVLQLHLKPAFA